MQDNLPSVRLDGVVTVADADALIRFPHLGHTTRQQIEAADLILLNKVDLVSAAELEQAQAELSRLHPRHSDRPDAALPGRPGAAVRAACREHPVQPHRPIGISPQFESISYTTAALLDRRCFETFVEGLWPAVYRAKGFVRCP